MLSYLTDILDNFISIWRMMTIVDYLDILMLSWLVYKLMKLVRETRAEQLIRGILLLSVIMLLFKQLEFTAMSVLSDMFFNVGIIAIIVMFQPELRRILEKMGRTKMVKSIAFNLENNPGDLSTKNVNMIEQISISCEKLSRTATGALIVIERSTKLSDYAATGTLLNATPSEQLFGNIFFPNTPLHDGAVIMRDGLVYAAGCFLPKPNNEVIIDKALGTRHRAAIGMSEVSDAIIIVVSEETGIISVAENGELKRGFSRQQLHDYLYEQLLSEDDTKKSKKLFSLKKQKNGQENDSLESKATNTKPGANAAESIADNEGEAAAQSNEAVTESPKSQKSNASRNTAAKKSPSAKKKGRGGRR